VTVPLTALKSQDVVARTDSLTAPLKSPETADLLETTTLGRVTTTDPMTPDFGVACDRHYDIRTCGTTDTATAQPVTMTDAMTIIGISTLSQAVDMLREDLAIANSSVLSERERAGHAERQLEMERQLVEDGRKRIDELQALLPAGRRQIDTLYVDLADARTAALITGCEAAALRAQADERRSWRLLRRLRWALRGE
jgi:hypothetical protein